MSDNTVIKRSIVIPAGEYTIADFQKITAGCNDVILEDLVTLSGPFPEFDLGFNDTFVRTESMILIKDKKP